MCREGGQKSSCNRTMNCFENMTSKNRIINDRRQQAEELAEDVGLEKPSEGKSLVGPNQNNA